MTIKYEQTVKALVRTLIDNVTQLDFSPYHADDVMLFNQITGAEGFVETGYLQTGDKTTVPFDLASQFFQLSEGGKLVDLFKELYKLYPEHFESEAQRFISFMEVNGVAYVYAGKKPTDASYQSYDSEKAEKYIIDNYLAINNEAYEQSYRLGAVTRLMNALNVYGSRYIIEKFLDKGIIVNHLDVLHKPELRAVRLRKILTDMAEFKTPERDGFIIPDTVKQHMSGIELNLTEVIIRTQNVFFNKELTPDEKAIKGLAVLLSARPEFFESLLDDWFHKSMAYYNRLALHNRFEALLSDYQNWMLNKMRKNEMERELAKVNTTPKADVAAEQVTPSQAPEVDSTVYAKPESPYIHFMGTEHLTTVALPQLTNLGEEVAHVLNILNKVEDVATAMKIVKTVVHRSDNQRELLVNVLGETFVIENLDPLDPRRRSQTLEDTLEMGMGIKEQPQVTTNQLADRKVGTKTMQDNVMDKIREQVQAMLTEFLLKLKREGVETYSFEALKVMGFMDKVYNRYPHMHNATLDVIVKDCMAPNLAGALKEGGQGLEYVDHAHSLGVLKTRGYVTMRNDKLNDFTEWLDKVEPNNPNLIVHGCECKEGCDNNIVFYKGRVNAEEATHILVNGMHYNKETAEGAAIEVAENATEKCKGCGQFHVNFPDLKSAQAMSAEQLLNAVFGTTPRGKAEDLNMDIIKGREQDDTLDLTFSFLNDPKVVEEIKAKRIRLADSMVDEIFKGGIRRGDFSMMGAKTDPEKSVLRPILFKLIMDDIEKGLSNLTPGDALARDWTDIKSKEEQPKQEEAPRDRKKAYISGGTPEMVEQIAKMFTDAGCEVIHGTPEEVQVPESAKLPEGIIKAFHEVEKAGLSFPEMMTMISANNGGFDIPVEEDEELENPFQLGTVQFNGYAGLYRVSMSYDYVNDIGTINYANGTGNGTFSVKFPEGVNLETFWFELGQCFKAPYDIKINDVIKAHEGVKL